jgi:hypothetical protein
MAIGPLIVAQSNTLARQTMKRLLFGLLLMTAPSLLRAQWFTAANGEYAYNFEYTTRVQFSCGYPMPTSTCATDGTSLTIGSGDAWATLTFASYTGSGVATNVRTGGFAIGAFNLTYGGSSQFLWPIPTNQAALFFARVTVQETGPIVSTSSLTRGFRTVNPFELTDNCCEGTGRYVQLGMSEPPPAVIGPVAIIIDEFSPMTIAAGDTTLTVTAAIGIVPEPSTWAMILIGLGGIAAVRRRTKARA